MKKLFILLTMLIVGIGSMWATPTTVTFSDKTNDPTTYGSLSGTTFTTNAASGMAGVTLSGVNWKGKVNDTYGYCIGCTDVSSGTVTITAPEGYVIIGYTLTGRLNTSNFVFTLTPSAGGNAVALTTSGKTVSANYLDAQTASFTYAVTTNNTNPKVDVNTFYMPNLTVTIGTAEDAAFAKSQLAAYNIVQGWVNTIQSAQGLVTDPGNYISNAKSSAEGTYAALVDGDYTTYFHGAYGGEGPNEDQYLQATLPSAVNAIYFYFKKRSQNNNNRPTSITISGSNDGTNFTDITTISSGLPTAADVIDYTSSKINLGASYQYLRFTVTATNNGATNSKGHVFFTFSEFYLLPSNNDVDVVMDLRASLAGTSAINYTAQNISDVTTANTALLSTMVNVTYELYETDGTTLLSSTTVEQLKNSDISIPVAFMQNTYYYNYNATGSIGTEDCTIKVTRTLKNSNIVYPISNLSNSKSYYIYTRNRERGGLSTYTDGGNTYLAISIKGGLNVDPKKFAIINYENNYYLYSVEDNKFVTYDGSNITKAALANTITGTTDRITFHNTTAPLYQIRFDNSSNKIFNGSNSSSYPYGMIYNNYSTWDDGNQFTIEEAEDLDATTSLEIEKSLRQYEVRNASKIPALFSSTAVEDAITNIQAATTTEEVATAYDNFWRTAEGKKFYAVNNTATGRYMNIGTSQITATSTSLTVDAFMELEYAGSGSGKYYLKGVNSGYYAGYPTSGSKNPGTMSSQSSAAPFYIGNYAGNPDNVLYFTTSRSTEYTTAIHYNSGYSGYVVAWTYNVGASQWNITALDEEFADLKDASKFDILEGSTVMGPSEFAAPASINAAIDAAQEVADNDEAKIAFIVSSNGKMIQNYLNQVATWGALANIQITMSKEYGTLILPCPCARIEGLDIYSCEAKDNNTLTLTPVDGIYAQNVPYIIHATAGNKYTIIGWDKGGTETYTSGWLTGVLNSTTNIPDGSYMLATNKNTGVQAFYKISGTGIKCPINKCYLTVPSDARTLYLDIDGEVTAIEEVFGEETEKQGTIYNLAGQRLTKAQKGINIINGKKVLK